MRTQLGQEIEGDEDAGKVDEVEAVGDAEPRREIELRGIDDEQCDCYGEDSHSCCELDDISLEQRSKNMVEFRFGVFLHGGKCRSSSDIPSVL